MRPFGNLQACLEDHQAAQAARLLHVEEEQVESLVTSLEFPVAVFTTGAELGFPQSVGVLFQMLADGIAGQRGQRLSEPATDRLSFRGGLFQSGLRSHRLDPLTALGLDQVFDGAMVKDRGVAGYQVAAIRQQRILEGGYRAGRGSDQDHRRRRIFGLVAGENGRGGRTTARARKATT